MEDHNVQVMSREFVKPSSEIQNDHPKTLKLSYLDQLFSPVYVPIIFFYQANEFISTSNHCQISQKLKNSLSHTLSSFYPLAGRVIGEDNTVVDCNDAGIEFVEARVQAQLVDALKRLDDKSKQYVPLDIANYYSSTLGLSEKPFLFVQITFFDCGGIALGIYFSHLFTDANSIVMFINAWASICKSQEIPQMPSFDLANYFPPRELPHIGFGASDRKITCKTNTKMLVLDEKKIAALKREAISCTVKDPTRVEVISAFIWKILIDTCTIKTKSVFVIHSVNLRGRTSWINLKNVFGNCFIASTIHADDGVVEFQALVKKLRRSIRKIDDYYIKESQNGDNYVNDVYKMISDLLSGGEMEGYTFSSWCRFPFYEVDYGFGTPILFYPIVEAKNTIILVSNKTGENIQVWVNMEQHKIDMLEDQINLISSTITV